MLCFSRQGYHICIVVDYFKIVVVYIYLHVWKSKCTHIHAHIHIHENYQIERVKNTITAYFSACLSPTTRKITSSEMTKESNKINKPNSELVSELADQGWVNIFKIR